MWLHLKCKVTRLLFWSSGEESTCQCRGHRFDPWSGKIPHAPGWLSPCTMTAEPELWGLWAAPTEASTQLWRPGRAKNKQISKFSVNSYLCSSCYISSAGQDGCKWIYMMKAYMPCEVCLYFESNIELLTGPEKGSDIIRCVFWNAHPGRSMGHGSERT